MLIWVLQAIICDDGLQPELLAILVNCYVEACTVYWIYVFAWEHNLAIVVDQQNIDGPFNFNFHSLVDKTFNFRNPGL